MDRKPKNKAAYFVAASVALAAIAAVVAVYSVRVATHLVPVVVAARDIDAYSEITPMSVRMEEVPAGAVTADTLRSLDEAAGKYARTAILAGTPVRKANLATAGGHGLLAAQLTDMKAPEMRAFAIPYTPDTAVAGRITPGDRVDVVAAVRVESASGTVSMAKIIAAGVEVLDVTQQSATADTKQTVVVAVTPAQAEDIAYALVAGSVRLALNPYNSDLTAATSTHGVTGATFLASHGLQVVPVPASRGEVKP